jgi:hypothetical protein
MTPQKAISYYGTQVAVAAQLRVTQPSVANWVKRGYIPAAPQLRLEELSGGDLKADRWVRTKGKPRRSL